MASIKRFEEMDAWRKARELAKAVYTATWGESFSRDFALRDQIRRAVISVMSNIAEGFDRAGNRELVQFLSVAKGSVAEVQSQLYIALDVQYIGQEQFDTLYQLAGDTSRLIGGFMRYLSTSEHKGVKYK